jgi:N-acetylneuraminic acid mutarotase
MKTNFIFTTLFLGLIAISSFSQEIEWNSKASIPYKIYSGSAVTCQEKIYFMAGQKDLGSSNFIASSMICEYNLALDEWIEKPRMLTARWNMALASVDDKIYAIGGDSFLDNNEMYDPTTEAWETLTPMPTARQHVKAAVVDNKIYVIGGLESWSIVSSKNEVYDPQTDTWEEKAAIPTPKHNYSTAVYNDKIYIFGGSTKIDGDIWSQTSTVEVYDPATNVWDTSYSLPSVRFNPGIGLFNNKIIILGGFAGDEVINSVDIFDPVTGVWSQSDTLPTKNVAMGSTILNNKIYIIGGTAGPSDNWSGYNTVYEGTISDSSTGVEKFSNNDDLLIFPNPAKNYIEFHATDHQYVLINFQILTIDGKIIKEGNFNFERINISDLSKGIFLLKIKTDKGRITKKFVIE